MKGFSFNLNLGSTEFVPTNTAVHQPYLGSVYPVYDQPQTMIFPDDEYQYYQQVSSLLDYALTKENMSFYFPETHIQYSEHKDIAVSLNSISDLLVRSGISPDRNIVLSIVKEIDKVILDEENGVVKPNPNYRTCIVLRDMKDQAEVEELLSHYLGNVLYLYPDLNLFYVYFNSPEATQNAFAHLNQLKEAGRDISCFIKSDNYKATTFVDPYYQNQYQNDSDNSHNQNGYQKKEYRNNRKNTNSNSNSNNSNSNNSNNRGQQKKKQRPSQISIGDDFPPLENAVKGGYEKEFKRYTIENMINIISKQAALEPPITNSPTSPVLLSEQNTVLEHSKKVQRSKEPIFLSDTKRRGNNTNKNKNNNKNKQKKQQNDGKQNKMRYADVVKETSPVKKTADPDSPQSPPETESPETAEKKE